MGQEASYLINHVCNCVLIHPECHTQGQFLRQGKIACERYLLYMEGYARIIEWLRGMAQHSRSDIIPEKIRLLCELAWDMGYLGRTEKPHLKGEW